MARSGNGKQRCKHDKPLDVCANCTAVEQIAEGRVKDGVVIHPDGTESPLSSVLCKHNIFPEVCNECIPTEAFTRGETAVSPDGVYSGDTCEHGVLWTADHCAGCDGTAKAASTKNDAGEPKVYQGKHGGYYTSWYTPCTHDSSKPVVTINGCGIYACRWNTTSDWKAVPDYHLLIDCRGDGEREHLKLPRQLEHLRKYVKRDPWTIGIPWPDRQAPPLEFGFWKGLVKSLPKDGVCIVTCIGAHGRTGTAIAAMLIAASPGLSDLDAIAQVRKLHCDEAIESQSQEDYLKAMALACCPKDKRQAMIDAHAADDAARAARAAKLKANSPKGDCFCNVTSGYKCSKHDNQCYCRPTDKPPYVCSRCEMKRKDGFDANGVLITHTVAPCLKGERHYGVCQTKPETVDALTLAGD